MFSSDLKFLLRSLLFKIWNLSVLWGKSIFYRCILSRFGCSVQKSARHVFKIGSSVEKTQKTCFLQPFFMGKKTKIVISDLIMCSRTYGTPLNVRLKYIWFIAYLQLKTSLVRVIDCAKLTVRSWAGVCGVRPARSRQVAADIQLTAHL